MDHAGIAKKTAGAETKNAERHPRSGFPGMRVPFTPVTVLAAFLCVVGLYAFSAVTGGEQTGVPADSVLSELPQTGKKAENPEDGGKLIFTLPGAIPEAPLPSLSASAAVLYCPETGSVLCGKNENERRPMASTTKIMTAVVVLENRSLTDIVCVDARAVGTEGSSAYLSAGEKASVETLLYALLLNSANDAAAALAYDTAGSIEAFAAMMNEKAAALGLNDTRFVNPSGLPDEEHYTTAYDLARLAAYALEKEIFARIVGTERVTFESEGGAVRLFVNHNKLLRFRDDVIGVKTGFTKSSGRCLVGAARRGELTLIAVTLDAPDDWNDHCALFDSGFSILRGEKAAENGEYVFDVPVVGSAAKQSVRCRAYGEAAAILPADAVGIESSTELPRFLYAPVCHGDAVGQIVFSVGDAEIGRLEIFAEEDAEGPEKKNGLFSFLKK